MTRENPRSVCGLRMTRPTDCTQTMKLRVGRADTKMVASGASAPMDSLCTATRPWIRPARKSAMILRDSSLLCRADRTRQMRGECPGVEPGEPASPLPSTHSPRISRVRVVAGHSEVTCPVLGPPDRDMGTSHVADRLQRNRDPWSHGPSRRPAAVMVTEAGVEPDSWQGVLLASWRRSTGFRPPGQSLASRLRLRLGPSLRAVTSGSPR